MSKKSLNFSIIQMEGIRNFDIIEESIWSQLFCKCALLLERLIKLECISTSLITEYSFRTRQCTNARSVEHLYDYPFSVLTWHSWALVLLSISNSNYSLKIWFKSKSVNQLIFWHYKKQISNRLLERHTLIQCWIKFISFAMKFFQLIQTNFKLLGIDAAKRNDRSNARNLYAQFVIFQFLFFTAAYLLFQVESFREYADCFYASSTLVGVSINIMYVSKNMGKMFELFESIESFIEKREL